MGQPTQRFKKSVSGSIGAGMKSVIGGDGRRFFVLEHKVSSKYHKAGEEQKIIVDQIEIGRDPQCAVRLEGTDPNAKFHKFIPRKILYKQRKVVYNGEARPQKLFLL